MTHASKRVPKEVTKKKQCSDTYNVPGNHHAKSNQVNTNRKH